MSQLKAQISEKRLLLSKSATPKWDIIGLKRKITNYLRVPSKQMKKRIKKIEENMLAISVVIAVLFWFVESALDTYVFHEGSYFARLMSPDPNEAWMRVFIGIAFIGFGAYAQKWIAKLRKVEREQKQILETLKHVNTDLQQFAYVASHDLQEPLRRVSGYLQLLSRRYKGRLDADADEFIGYAVNGAKSMQEMVEDLLSYSRIGTRSTQSQLTDCAVLFNQVLTELKEEIEESEAAVTVDTLPKLQVNTALLYQVIQSLIGNAIKFRGVQPLEIHIGAVQREFVWRFSIRDNGIGFDQKYAERIFILFQRLNDKDGHPGTGIGLAITKKIVEHLGGEIWAESKPESGSIFYFTIPESRDRKKLEALSNESSEKQKVGKNAA